MVIVLLVDENVGREAVVVEEATEETDEDAVAFVLVEVDNRILAIIIRYLYFRSISFLTRKSQPLDLREILDSKSKRPLE